MMKTKLAIVTLIASLAVTGSAFARGGMGPVMGVGGCQQFGQVGMSDQQKKFIAATLPLRDEMHAKRTMLMKELIKDEPDNAIITKLQGELQTLRQKMYEVRTKAGFPMMKAGKRGMRGMHHGMMGGCGPCAVPSATPVK